MFTKRIYRVLVIGLMPVLIMQEAAAGSNKSIFDRFTELKGTWVMEGQEDIEFVFNVAAEGSVVMEESMGMITMIHRDGDNLRLTHYCPMGNQPTLLVKDTPYDTDIVDFDLDRVGNLKPDVGHISDVVYEWLSDGRLKETWTGVDPKGVSGSPEVFILKRKEVSP